MCFQPLFFTGMDFQSFPGSQLSSCSAAQGIHVSTLTPTLQYRRYVGSIAAM